MADQLDQLAGSKKLMLAALLQRMNQPQTSPIGAGANALSMGLMGLLEGQDENRMLNLAVQKDAASKAAVDRATNAPPAVSSPMGNVPPPTPAPQQGYAMPDRQFAANEFNPMDAQAARGPELKVALADALKQNPQAIDAGVRTIVGEARGEPPIGQQAVGNVMLNRSQGQALPLDKVVSAPNQFEGYGIPATRVPETSPQYTNAARALFMASQADPTGGATHFYSPGEQAALGRQPPAWDNGTGQTIGSQRFFQNPDRVAQVAPSVPANAPAQLPVPQELREYERNAELARQKGDGKAYQFWVQQATAAREGYLKSLQDIAVEQQKKLNVPPEKFTYDGREFTRDLRSGKITEITPQPQQGSTLNQAQAKERSDLRQEIMTTPQFKNIAQVAPVYKSMLDAAKMDNRASDLNLVYGLAKLMDPGSVVREGEVGMAQAVATLPAQLQAAIMSQLQGTGRLDPPTRAALMEQAHSRIQAYASEYENASQLYGRVAAQRGFKQEDVAPSFGPFEKYAPPAAALPSRDQALEILKQRMRQQGR